jgi:DNA-binding transcriptional LysR family regulator
MALTDAGRDLIRQAAFILSNIEEASAGLKAFSRGERATIRLAGLNSMLRVLLPRTIVGTRDEFPGIELDIHEAAPAEALDLLYGRRVDIGLIAENSVAKASVGFSQQPIATDPYVFAVPEGIDLDGVVDPDGELNPAQRDIVNSCIQFTFGTQHTRRVEQWYAQVLPRHRLLAQCRSYEMAMAMVQAGLGVCLVPAFTALDGDKPLAGVRLYRSTEPERQIVALMPRQYQRLDPYRSFLAALQQTGERTIVPGILETPHFLHRAETTIG